MVQKTISIVGSLNYDLIMIANRMPDGGESLMANEYSEALGGKGANAAIATFRTCHKKPHDAHEAPPVDTLELPNGVQLDEQPAKEADAPKEELEINVKMIGAVGDDKYGERFYAELTKNGVDCSGIVTVENTQSSICFVMIEDYTRENRCLFTLRATETWKEEHFMSIEQLGHGVRPDLCVAQLEIRKEVVERMIETAGKAGIPFILNAAPASPLKKRTYQWITHLLVNETEAAILSGRDLKEVHKDSWDTICQEFIRRGVENVVITLGSKGAYYANAKDRGHCRGYTVEVVDSTGAGDTFTGAYSSDYLNQLEFLGPGGWDIKRAVLRANKAAALTITKLGAQGGIPWSDEIELFEAPLNDSDLAELRLEGDAL